MGLFAFGAMAQTAEINDRNCKAYDLTSDTLTNGDTITVTLPFIFYDNWSGSFAVVVDSLTGAIAGTAYIQQSNSTGTGDWHNVTDGTKVINGVQTTWLKDIAAMYGCRYRLRVIHTETGTAKVNAYFIGKK